MATKPEYELDGWQEAKAIADYLTSTQGEQKNIISEMEEMYFIDWPEHKREAAEIKRTISPDPRNKIRGAANLLTSTVPHFDVPKDKNNPDVSEKASALEKAAEMMWMRSNRIQGTKVERELAKSAFLSDQIYIQVVSTQDILTAAMDAEKVADTPRAKAIAKARLRRAKERAALTPYYFEPINPKVGYPYRAGRDLIGFYKETETVVADVRAIFGGRVKTTRKDTDTVTLHDYYDEAYRYVWMEGMDDPILAELHGLDFLPIVAWTPEGSLMFSDVERQIEPFLLTLKRSGLWERQNLVLTAVATNLAKIINAGFVYAPGTQDAELETIRHDVIGNVVNVGQGGNLQPMSKNIIDQNVMGFLDIVNGLADESTLYDQSLGQAMGSGASFSLYAMVARTGMLPIVPVKQALGDAIGAAVEIAFKWMKMSKKASMQRGYMDVLEIPTKDIPDVVEVVATVDVQLPQDNLENANIFNILNGKVSNEWLMETVLKIGQPEAMRKQIWREQASEMAAQGVMQAFMQQMMQKMQQAQQRPERRPTTNDGRPPTEKPMPEEGQPMQGPPMPGQMGDETELQGLPPVQMGQEPMTRPVGEQIPPDLEAENAND